MFERTSLSGLDLAPLVTEGSNVRLESHLSIHELTHDVQSNVTSVVYTVAVHARVVHVVLGQLLGSHRVHVSSMREGGGRVKRFTELVCVV